MTTSRPFIVVAFGDSITAANEVQPVEKWTSILDGMLVERFGEGRVKLINAGVGGNTSREGLVRMQRDVLDHDPDLVLVQFGGNDSTFEPHRAISSSEFTTNLGIIKSRIDALGHTDVIVACHPPVVDHKHVYFKHPEVLARGVGINDGVEVYRKLARQFATDHGLPLVDLYAAIVNDLDGNIRADGTHLTSMGNRRIAEAFFPTVVATILAR